MNLIRIAVFNIKKKKGAVLALTILIILASIFLNIGLNVTGNLSSFFYNKSEELHSPYYVSLFENNKYSPAYLQFLKDDQRVTECEAYEVVYMESAEWTNENSKEKIPFPTMVCNMDENYKLSAFQLVEADEDIKNNGVYLPISLKGFGYKIGDDLKITFKNSDYKFKVAGFFETTVFGTRSCGMFKIYLKDADYKNIHNSVGGAKLISARMKNIDMAALVMNDLNGAIKNIITSTDDSQSIISGTYEDFTTANTLMANMIGAFLVIFSIIITFILILVIKFKIKNDIKENLTNIGVLGAIGFKSKEICKIYVFEFMILAVSGTILGILFSYISMPLLSSIISNMVGIIWNNKLHIISDLMTALIIIGFIFLISFLASMSVRKYPPIVAFHEGIEAHNFRKNRFKLSKGRLNVNIKLALKGFSTAIYQNIVTGIIIASVTFATIFCTVLYTNFVADYKVLTKMAGFEMCSFEITTTKNTDAEKLAEEINNMDEVRKTNLLDYKKINIEQHETPVQICSDFEKLETLSVYEGRFPKHENEVVITGILGEEFNKKIGDSVTLTSGGYSGKYIITGFMQTMSEGGKMVLLNNEGIKHIMPGYSLKVIEVYLNNNDDMNNVISKINNKYGDFSEADKNNEYSDVYKTVQEKVSNALKLYDASSLDYAVMADGKIIVSGNSDQCKIEKIQDIRNVIDSSLGPIVSGIYGLSSIIGISTMFIIILILSLMIKAMIIKRKIEFGIFKAIGYTTHQLMCQIALSFMPTVIIGCISGSVIGFLSVSPLLSTALHGVGISKFDAAINIPAIIIVNIVIIVFTFFAAMYEAGKVRKISVYGLLTE